MKEQPQKAREGTPTPKMLAYAQKIAAKLGKELPAEAQRDFAACGDFIDAHKDEANRPSDRQPAFAREVADRNQLEIPSALLTDSQGLSKWIDAHK